MSKHTKKTYAELIAAFPLRPITTERMNAKACRIANDLALHENTLSKDEQDYLDVLSTLIEQFEEARYPMGESVTPLSALRFLIEENGLTLSKLAEETGIKVSTLSEILSGKRRLNLFHVTVLAQRFRVDATLFIEKQAAVSVAG